jgi:ABC-type multidrug transport system permease subunit
LFTAAGNAGIHIHSVEVKEPNLETVFLHLTVILYFAFGRSEKSGPQLDPIHLGILNNDEGSEMLQAGILIALSSLIFRISWNRPAELIFFTIAIVISASGFNIFIMSFVSNSRQFGPISSAVNTVAGMVGGLFTIGAPNLPEVFSTIMKLVPHGWAILGYRALLMEPESSGTVYASIAVCAVSGIVLLFAGTLIVRRKLQ